LTPLLAFEPENDIERQIASARDGGLSGDELMRRIAAADLYIPSTAEVQTDGSGFGPVLLEQNDLAFVAVFTAMSRQPKDMARTMMRANGRHFFLRLPAGYGVIFNPGYDAQILLPPDGAAALKQDLQAG
jgi:hypothetical protein